MMAFLLFLIVLALSYSNGTARSINSISSESYSDKIFKLPTVLEQGLSITIKGNLNTDDKTFKVALGDYDDSADDCRIMLDFASQTILVTSANNFQEEEPYDLRLENEVETSFSLRIIARRNKGKDMLALSLQVDKLGESPQLICSVKNFESIRYIKVMEGVARINSLLFEF